MSRESVSALYAAVVWDMRNPGSINQARITQM
jgi:hypothetical protein